MAHTIRIINLVYCGDLYKFYVDEENCLVKTEKYFMGTCFHDEQVTYSEVPEPLKDQLREHLI